jgi:pyruvate/2-oxoglutarate dehydrogenase complex dihydrolipoamide dehydrogenase (E3) component
MQRSNMDLNWRLLKRIGCMEPYGGCVPSKLLIRSADVAETIKYEQADGPYFFNQQNLAHKGKKL